MPPTVLIVDDHAGFRATARTLLADDGWEVVGEAADGASALEAVRRLAPEVVLLDVQLPDMDGFAVTERLREGGNGASLDVILTSSRDVCEFGRLVAESGARGFVPKGELSGAALRAVLR